jgi:hypothetical protein
LETDARALTVFEEVVAMLRLETFLTVPLLFVADVFEIVFFFFAVALAMFLSRQNEWKNLKNLRFTVESKNGIFSLRHTRSNDLSFSLSKTTS